jgi:hypothetical protein
LGQKPPTPTTPLNTYEVGGKQERKT